MIPNFPQFKPLEVTDKKEIDRYTSIFPPYSDFNFVSLYSWNIEEKIELSILNENLVVKFQDYMNGDQFYSFIGNTDVTNTCKILLDHAQKTGIVTKLQLIPEHVIQIEKDLNNHFNIEEDRASFDYIHSVSEIAQLSHREYYSKLKHLKNFNKQYPDHSIKILDITDDIAKKELLEVFYSWEKGKNKERTYTWRELKSIERLIENAHHFNLIVIGIYHGDHLVGFAVGEIVDKSHSIFHYVKADPQYKGIFTALYNILAKNLHEKEIAYLNIEQDLGIEGLINAKKQWRPISFLKKYTISHKEQIIH